MTDREHPIQGMMNTAMEKIRQMVDVNTIIGDPIAAGGTIIIPVSKVSFGFASGGSDFPSKVPKDMFGGASGAGISIQPLGFLIVADGDVRLLQMTVNTDVKSGLVGLVPEVMDKVVDLFGKGKQTKAVDPDAIPSSHE